MEITELDPFEPGQVIADGNIYTAHAVTAYRLAWGVLGSMNRDEVEEFRRAILSNEVVGTEAQEHRHLALLGPRILALMYDASGAKGLDGRPAHHILLAVQALSDLKAAIEEYKASLRADDASRKRREDNASVALLNAVSGAHWASALRMAWKQANVDFPSLLEHAVPLVLSKSQSAVAARKNATARAAALGLWASGTFGGDRDAWVEAVLAMPEVKAMKSSDKRRVIKDWLSKHLMRSRRLPANAKMPP